MCCILFFFFFKQKTAYEMRISDWSSDVCSSDLDPTYRRHPMATTRHATAHWSGDLKTGGGTISTPQSGLMAETAYGFNTRFGDGNPNASRGTNPEELIAAAHSACFTIDRKGVGWGKRVSCRGDLVC